MSDRHELFETLEPPSGGLERLHARIDRDRRRRLRQRIQVSAAAVLVAALVGWWAFVPRDGGLAGSPELDLARVALGQRPGPTEALTIPPALRGEMAARRVPLPKDDVVFYMVASVHDVTGTGEETH